MCKQIAAGVIAVAICICGHFALARQREEKLRVRDFMSREQFQAAGLNKLSAAELAVLDQWFTDIAKKPVKLEASKAGSGKTTDFNDFSLLEGATIVAEDGQFLGKITANSVDSQSIINEVGKYGSEVSSTSIRNSVGRYGSTVAPLSAFNNVASTPPRIYKNGRFIAYLTANSTKTSRVDPKALIGWLQSQQ